MNGQAILAALPAALYELAEQAAFRIYVTDCLYYSGRNRVLNRRYAEIIGMDGGNDAPTEAEIDAMAARLGITFVEEAKG